MAEEHGFQSPEGHRLCANNCGFFGSPATSNLCSKCFRDLQMKERQDVLAKAALDGNNSSSDNHKSSPLSPPTSFVSPPPYQLPDPEALTFTTASSSSSRVIPALKLPESAGIVGGVSTADLASVQPKVARSNRCLTCRKRVGLTGFRCRCGSVFCGSHRYPEQHGCTIDYKALGKEEIARANPVVKAAKLKKI